MPKATLTVSTTDDPTVSDTVRVYSAGTAGGCTRCHNEAPLTDRVVFQTIVELAAAVPAPLPLATTVPLLSVTARERPNGMLVEPLLETSMKGQTAASAIGVPSAAHLH